MVSYLSFSIFEHTRYGLQEMSWPLATPEPVLGVDEQEASAAIIEISIAETIQRLQLHHLITVLKPKMHGYQIKAKHDAEFKDAGFHPG